MNPDDPRLAACTAFLLDVNGRGASRDEAREGLARLRAAMPEARLDLVWDAEVIGARVVYSLLVAIDGWTYSFGAVPHGALPWPLRGAVEPRAEVLVTVDGAPVTVAQAIGLLDFVWRSKPIADRLVDAALLAKERDQWDGEPGPEEVDAALVRFRAGRGLEDDRAYGAWLKERHIEDENLRAWIAGVLMNRGVEEAIVGPRLEAELAQPEAYARARVAVLEIGDSERELAERLVAQGRDVLEIAEVLGRGAGPRSVEVRDVLRHEAPAVFEAGDGATRVVSLAGSLAAAKVLEREVAAPVDAVRNRATKRLIADHFREQRARANVEWHWGPETLPGTTFSK